MSERQNIDEFTHRPDLRKKRAVAMAVQRAAIALFIIYCIVTMTMLLILAAQSQGQRQTLTDCTIPTGHCYKEGQQRTAEAIQFLIDDNQLTRDTVIAAIACGQDPANDTKEEVLACVKEKGK